MERGVKRALFKRSIDKSIYKWLIMGEKRKPKYTILLRRKGIRKASKLELFPASLWTNHYTKNDNLRRDRFRLRVNGIWWPKGKMEFVTKTQVKELMFKRLES